MAAAIGESDSPAMHAADTIAAGDGLCDMVIVDCFTRSAPMAIEKLARLAVRFDRTKDGGFALGLEAAHGRPRIVHVGGDGAGRELMRALVVAARATPSIRNFRGIRGATDCCREQFGSWRSRGRTRRTRAVCDRKSRDRYRRNWWAL